MPAIKGKGFVQPDKTKRYAVVEIPTAGDKKGITTKVFEQELTWEEAQKLKNELAAKRVTKFATVIEMPSLEHKSEGSPAAGAQTRDAVKETASNAASGRLPDGRFDESDVQTSME